jgi:hypothetical protein
LLTRRRKIVRCNTLDHYSEAPQQQPSSQESAWLL